MQDSPIRKFNAMAFSRENAGTHVHWLNIGQPDISTPSCFMDAVRGFDEDVLAYTQSAGWDRLQQAVCDYYELYGVALKPADIIVTTGGSEALSMAVTCILNSGEELMTAEPFYTNYNTFVQAAGGQIAAIPTRAEEGYRYAERERLEAACNDRVRAILCTTPGNPTGCILDHDEMRVIGEFAREHDLWIIADEVYREFCYDGRKPASFGELPEYADRVILIDSVSKRFSACGARIGALISKNEEFIHAAMKLAMGRLRSPTLDQLGAEALYHLPVSYYDDVRREYEQRRDAFYEEIMKDDEIVCKKPGGAFYMTLKLPVENSEDFLRYMLTRFDEDGETVMFTPAEGFYQTPGKGRDEIRIAYVLRSAEMRRAAELLRHGLTVWRETGGDGGNAGAAAGSAGPGQTPGKGTE